jgi:hypothetical protein
MTRLASTLVVLGLCAAVSACATGPSSQNVMSKEDLMIASGFKFVPANTPERQAAFQKLPPHKFTREVRGDKVVYVYADPTICVCLYVGNPTSFQAYRARVFDKKIADEQLTVANDFYYMDNWNWGVWNVGYPPAWPYDY